MKGITLKKTLQQKHGYSFDIKNYDIKKRFFWRRFVIRLMKAEKLLSGLNGPSKESFLKFFKSDINLSMSSMVEVYRLFKIKLAAFNAGDSQNEF